MMIENENKAKDYNPKALAHFFSSALGLEEQFRNMAEAEQRHAEIVREIIDLVNNT